jgi:hypothetical protein
MNMEINATMMKTTQRLFLALSLVVLAAAPQAVLADDAATAAVAEPFTIALPEGYAGFTKQTQTADSPDGKIETTNWVSKAPTGEALVVTLSKMPGKILDPEKLITSTRDTLLKSLGASAETDANLFRSKAAVFRSHFVVDEDRFFQLLYVGRSDEQRNAPVVGQVFESFKVK